MSGPPLPPCPDGVRDEVRERYEALRETATHLTRHDQETVLAYARSAAMTDACEEKLLEIAASGQKDAATLTHYRVLYAAAATRCTAMMRLLGCKVTDRMRVEGAGGLWNQDEFE